MPTEQNQSDWWDCPVCGEQTTLEGEPSRQCTECEWSVTIPTVSEEEWQEFQERVENES